MKKIGTVILSLGCLLGMNAQNDFPDSGDAKIQDANLTIETSQWRPSLLTLRDTHYNPNQVYHFQLESDGLKIKQDGEVNYQFKSGGNFIVRNGNTMLGIGSPLYKLHIKDPFGGAAIGLERGGKLWRFDLQTNSDRLFIGHSDNSSIVTFHKDGKMGIGTTSPDAKLEVHDGSIEINSSPFAHFKILRDNGATASMGITSNTKHAYLSSAGELKFLTDLENADASTKMFLTRSGRLGIGTTSPDARLTVKGNIHAEEVKVDLSVPAPDYVFKEGYDLKSLQEIQDYIKEHGHLPNVPSAKELEENGIQLGVMNMKLLEKIEELTLYTLQQQKEILLLHEQLKKVDALQEQINNLLNQNQE
ncbi:tail fiber protein [Muricauda sp. SCSIO 64092]|uniref:tail fiber protein n=1 Tax=Allomuricauda sp. SCSIO 64092 TaxID=2908842 RepID=UPI001FF282C8|nr:tail fiber protein [Muricauda sp. SCSIO 64092]UOY08371.1 tail fiber protein [Muricauda sp. SCSIO 64092]